jgi:hypothetical protein
MLVSQNWCGGNGSNFEAPIVLLLFSLLAVTIGHYNDDGRHSDLIIGTLVGSCCSLWIKY